MLAMNSNFNKTIPQCEQECVCGGAARHGTWVGLLCAQHLHRCTPRQRSLHERTVKAELGILYQHWGTWHPSSPKWPVARERQEIKRSTALLALLLGGQFS